MKGKQATYNQVFNTELGKEVLSDLRIICHATKAIEAKDDAGRIDPVAMGILEGKRQVFMHIVNTMKIDYEDIYEYDYNE